MDQDKKPLPKYRCHKVVQAAKIVAIEHTSDDETTLSFGEAFDQVKVTSEFVAKNNPEVGGYYVVYSGGDYTSYSPAEAFESGYERIVERTGPDVIDVVAWSDPNSFEKRKFSPLAGEPFDPSADKAMQLTAATTSPRLGVRVLDEQGKTVVEKRLTAPFVIASEENPLNAAPGRYTLELTPLDEDGKPSGDMFNYPLVIGPLPDETPAPAADPVAPPPPAEKIIKSIKVSHPLQVGVKTTFTFDLAKPATVELSFHPAPTIQNPDVTPIEIGRSETGPDYAIEFTPDVSRTSGTLLIRATPFDAPHTYESAERKVTIKPAA